MRKLIWEEPGGLSLEADLPLRALCPDPWAVAVAGKLSSWIRPCSLFIERGPLLCSALHLQSLIFSFHSHLCVTDEESGEPRERNPKGAHGKWGLHLAVGDFPKLSAGVPYFQEGVWRCQMHCIFSPRISTSASQKLGTGYGEFAMSLEGSTLDAADFISFPSK